MKAKLWKATILVAALLLWAALSYYLLAVISFSDFELDFSLQNRLRTALGVAQESRAPSLVQPMLYMLYGSSGGILALIILQFASLIRSTLSARWLTFTRIMQVVIGLAAAILLAMIGFGLAATQADGTLPFVLSGFLSIRLICFTIHTLLAKR